MTRVTPSMLPPTIITAPTSAMARPNAVSRIVSTANRSCSSSTAPACSFVAPNECNWSPPSRSASSTSRRDSAAISGRTRMLCAMTIAVGVNRMPSGPSGPARDNSR